MISPDENDTPVSSDGTLGGYMAEHNRPPSFEGSDRHPYTVSVEIEQVGDLRVPWAGYLVFPRWTLGGRSVEGHVQSPLLSRGATRDEVLEELGALSLAEVKEILERAIVAREEEAC